jgi:DNA-binding CsgD family transcriptional regulator
MQGGPTIGAPVRDRLTAARRGNGTTSMGEADTLLSLTGGIYDAALDPSLWPDVLRQIAGFVGGPAAALYSKDASAKSGLVHFDDGGIDPYYVRLYFEKYVKVDPFTTGHFFAEIEQPLAATDLIPRDEFVNTRLYKEYLQPQGIIDHVSVALEKTATSVAMCGVFRHERDGFVDDAARWRMRLLAPHLRRAVLIGRAIDLKTAEAARFADTLDGIAAGLLMVDAAARIVHANVAGHAMLAAGDVLHASGGRLTAIDPQADRSLRDIVAASGSGDAAVGVTGIAVPLAAGDGERYVAHVLPLTSGARRRAGASYAAVAALFVHKAALATPAPPEVIARTYKLTPMELRVLLAVVEVGGVAEVAEALGIAGPTVKVHLSRLFEKTGARRQAELVKLVAGFANPLRS